MLKLLRDQVLVLPTSSDKTESGLYIPTTAYQQIKVGNVIGVGDGKRFENGHKFGLDVSVGDEILYGTGYTELDVDGEKCHIMVEDNVIGINMLTSPLSKQ